MKYNQGVVIFFKCMIGGFIISSFTNKVVGIPPMQVLNNMFLTFMANFIIGIWSGLFGMAFYYIKKNLKNERCRVVYRGI